MRILLLIKWSLWVSVVSIRINLFERTGNFSFLPKISNLTADLKKNNLKKHEEIYPFELVLSNFTKEKNPKNFEVLRICWHILRTRGLSRWLSGALLTETSEVYEKSYELNRIVLLRHLLHDRKILKNIISRNLRIREIHSSEEKNSHRFEISNYVPPVDYSDLKVQQYNILTLGKNLGALINPTIGTRIDLFLSLKPNLLEKLLFFIEDEELEKHLKKTQPTYFAKFDRFKKLSVNKLQNADFNFDEIAESELPAVQLLKNVEIWHGHMIIQSNTLLLHDLTADPRLKFVAGVWPYIGIKFKGAEGTILLKPNKEMDPISEAALLSGRADENWYHFLIDTLPRLVFLQDIPKRVPLIIRSDIPFTALKILNSISSREIIKLEPNTSVMIENLFVVPGRATTFDSKPPRNHEIVSFSPKTLSKLRELILTNSLISSKKNAPFVYISRESRYRKLVNSKEIEEELKSKNVEICKPNKEYFENQVTIFNNAKVIIAPGGATFANILFMEEGSKVISLQSWRNRDLNLWKLLASACGVNYKEVRGIPTYWGFAPLLRSHSNFYISLRRLRRMLSEFKA